MEARKWKYVVKRDMKSLGIYREEHGSVITVLSELLEERDRVKAQYKAEGSNPLVTVVSDRGAENKRKNPLLSTWQELNRDALQYWRDLGLTPAGFKKICGDSEENNKSNALDKILWDLETNE